MILNFDKFERYELPQITLCNPNSRTTEVDGKITITDTVGVLSNPKGMNLKLNFNAPHELSFDYYRHKSTDPIKQSFYDSIYEAIQTDRYIYLTNIGYFVISSVTDSDEDNIDKKLISLKSCEENELATAEGLHLKEGTYYLHTENNDGLLDLFLPKTAGWTIDFIDPSLLIKPYFVEDTEVDNGYNFLYTTIQDMFECIVEPDIIKRTISVYSRVYYAEHHLTDIHIAKYNLLKHKTIEENDEDKYTALNVQGKDENLEIRIVNPTGKNVIYNFEPRYSWMSPALQQAIEKWQEKCESVEEEYLTLQQDYYAELEKLFNEEQDIEVLKGELKTLEETRDAVLITTGEEQSTALDNVNAQISAKQTEINTATSNYNSHQATIQTTYEEPINQTNSDCALDLTAKDINGNTIFTAELLNELMTHIKPTDYVDEYMLVTESMTYPQRFEKAKELMNRAQSQLIKISSGQKTYSIDTRSFLFNKQFRHFSEQLCAGAIIYVETKNDTMEQLHLTSIDINFDEKSTNFTLGNKYDRSDLKALYEDALGQNSKSFSELKYIVSIIEDQQKQLDYQRNWVADLRTLTLDNILTSEDQAIEINNRGLIGRKRQLNADGSWKSDENGNPLFDPEQVKLINNSLIFTDKNWQNATTAVGKIAVGYNPDGSIKYAYGINGQVLIGELILGNNLVLTGTGAGIKIKDGNGKDAFYADNDGNLVLSGEINASGGTIGGWEIRPSYLCRPGSKKYDSTKEIYIVDKYGIGFLTDDSSGTNPAFYAGYDRSKNEANTDVPSGEQSWREHTAFSIAYNGSVNIGGVQDSSGKWQALVHYSGPTNTFTIRGNKGQDVFKVEGGYIKQKDENGKDVYVPDGTVSKISMNADLIDITGTIKGHVPSSTFNSYKEEANGKFVSNSKASKSSVTGWEINDSHFAIYGNNNNDTPVFSVNGDGTATFKGTVNATGGTIGGCSISDGVLKIANANITSLAVSKITGGTNKENITFSGNITAPSATITGKITATSGKFTNCTIDKTCTITKIEATEGSVGGWNIYNNATYGGYCLQGYKDSHNWVLLTPNNLYGSDAGYVRHAPWYNIAVTCETGSDKNIKDNILNIDEKYDKVFDSLQPSTFNYSDDVKSQLHFGFVAQDVLKSFSDIDVNNFAGLWKTEHYNLNKQEFIALNTWQIQKAKARITELENKVAELKTQIQTLTAG